MRRFALLCAMWCAAFLAAGSARAQVAVAPLVQSDDAVHRDVVGEIALAVFEDHEPLTPPLEAKDVAPCRDDVSCLLRAARERGASHLVRVSVAPLGTRDQVVAVALYSVADGAKEFEENTVLSTSRDVRPDARAIGERLASVAGLPKRRTESEAPAAVDAGTGTLTVVGAGLMIGAAVAAAGTGVGSSVMLAGTNPYPRAVGPVIVVGSALTAGLAIAAITLMAVDPGDVAAAD